MEKIEELRAVIKEECLKSIHYSSTVWNHSCNVENYSVVLGSRLGGDMGIIRPTGISHDCGSIRNGRSGKNGEGHEVTGARWIEPVLEGIGYSLEEIVQIQYGILVHRGSKRNIIRKTIEARIVATADAWDHFSNIDELWLVGQRDLGKTAEDTHKWLLKKMENDWFKVMPEAR